jgi:signal transduction histidine kinase
MNARPVRTLMLTNAALAALAGLGFAMFPGRMLTLLPFFEPGLRSSGGPLALVQLLGTLLFGTGFALWVLPEVETEGPRRKLLLGVFIGLSLVWLCLPLISRATRWAFPASFAVGALFYLVVRISIAAAVVLAARSLLRKPPRQIRLEEIRESAAQQERNRIARDLHDSIKQQLFSIRLSSAAAEERWESDPPGARSALIDVRRNAHAAMVEMQAMLAQLRPEPLAAAGLVEALREQCEALGYRSGARVDFDLGDLPPDNRLPPGTQEHLFRMAQEALSNVARHARASSVRVRLGQAEQEGIAGLLLLVHDDGQGFDPDGQPAGMGLRNLRERLAGLWGTLGIESAPGKGTEIRIFIPLTPESLPFDIGQAVRGLEAYVLSIALLGILAEPPNILTAGFALLAVAMVGLGLFSAAWHVGRRSAGGLHLSLLGHQHRFFLLAMAFWWTCVHLVQDPPSPSYSGMDQAMRLMALVSLALGFRELWGFFRLRRRRSRDDDKPPTPLLHPWIFAAIASLVLASLPWLFWADPGVVAQVALKTSGLLYVGWWLRSLP